MTDLGVLILALGDSAYGEQAYNLAMSIKFNHPKLRVQLCYTPSAISTLPDTVFFDVLTECDRNYYTDEDGKIAYIRAKLHLDEISIFSNTLFIDADAVLFPNSIIDIAFRKLGKVSFASTVLVPIDRDTLLPMEGYANGASVFSWFRKFKELVSLLNISNDIPFINSSVIIFTKDTVDGRSGTEVFEKARQLRSLKWIRPYILEFGNDYPDEALIDLAIAMLGFNVHSVNMGRPLWDQTIKEHKTEDSIRSNYVGVQYFGVEDQPYHLKHILTKLFEFYGRHFNKKVIKWRKKTRL